jgi:predicted RNase H-like HicB family nuclease
MGIGMLTYHWPCRVTKGDDGHYVVCPINLEDCSGSGATLEDGKEACRKALQKRIDESESDKLVALTVQQELDVRAVINGEIVRIEVEFHD